MYNMITIKMMKNMKKLLLSLGMGCLVVTGCSKNQQTALLPDAVVGVANEALKKALYEGNLGQVKQWVTTEKDAQIILDDGQYVPLHLAATCQYVRIAKYLVEECHASITSTDIQGNTPLHTAAMNNCVAVVTFLVKTCGASLDTKNNNGNTPLHSAAYQGYLATTRYLVQSCNAHPNATSKLGATPLHLAAQKGHLAVVKYLINEAW